MCSGKLCGRFLGRIMTSMRMLVRLVGGDPRACLIGIAGFTLASWSAGAVRAASWAAPNLSVKWGDWFVLGCATASAAAFLLCLLSLLREKAKLPALAGLLVLGVGEGYHSPLSGLKASTPNISRLTWMVGALLLAAVLIVCGGLLLRRRRRPTSGSLGL